MTNGKSGRVFNTKTGKYRDSEPIHDSGARNSHGTTMLPKNLGRTVPVVHGDSASSGLSLELSSNPMSVQEGVDEERKAQSKPKAEISTLEQFITNAYGLKGRKLSLKSKVEHQIAQDPKLSDEARERLLMLVKEDLTLGVPRQLLLTARDIVGYPGLRAAIRAFVRDVLLSHPLFLQPRVEAALRNLEDAPSPPDALKLLAASDKSLLIPIEAERMKDSEFNQLRVNATYCLAVWLAEVKGLTIGAVIEALHSAMWGAKAQQIDHETTKLRALTEIEELIGVGLACDEYRRQGVARQVAANEALRETAMLRNKVETLELELYALRDAASRAEKTYMHEKEVFQEQLDATILSAETQGAHLRDDFEQLRTRVLRRLKSDVSLLEDGLHALRRPEPKVHVMIDMAERTTDALRQEIRTLQGGE